MSYIRHITLTTGDARDSLPGEVPEAMTDAMRPLVEHILASGDNATTIPLSSVAPDVRGYSLSGHVSAKTLIATVWADGPPSVSVATIVVALRPRGASGHWKVMHRYSALPVATDPERMPPTPWVAARLDQGALGHIDAMGWLGDFERCLAWAWLRYRLPQMEAA